MNYYGSLFKRELDRLNYLYVKANTKSKKKQIAYDLIFFEDMYNHLSSGEDRIVFPWTYDEVLMDIRYDVTTDIVTNVLKDQNFIVKLVENSFNIFLENDFSVHGDHGKQYRRINDSLLQNSVISLLNSIDEELALKFNNKFDNKELFKNNTITGFVGLSFLIESLNKNVIFINSNGDICIEDGRILAHEMGHDFEFFNASKNGVTGIWNGIVRTLYPEVSSCFFEYAYINYLIENNLYKEDAMIMRRRYLNQIYYFFSYLLIIFSHSNLRIDPEFKIILNDQDIVDYANELLEKMNSSDDLYKVGDKLSFRVPFIYGIGKLLGIYVYEFYKNNPKEFLVNFKTALLQYKNIGLDAFSCLGITRESLLQGDILRKTLKNCK